MTEEWTLAIGNRSIKIFRIGDNNTMYCNLCNDTTTHEHFMPIYKVGIDGDIERSYYATVRGINHADETGYAVVDVELSQVYVPVYAATQQGDSPRNYIWIQDDTSKPLTPEQFHALY